MNRVWIRAAIKERHELAVFAQKVVDYVNVHPLPGPGSAAVVLTPAKLVSGKIAWRWELGEMTGGQTVWRCLADRWLNEHGDDINLSEFNGVLISVVDGGAALWTHDVLPVHKGESRVGNPEKIIKGEGLAEFSAIVPKFKMSDLIVEDELCQALRTAVALVQHSDLIYNVWGFKDVEPLPRAVLNFYGPPGTGKTMAAHCVAEALGKKIVIANFAEIESKYVGDSPKNLENIFRVAESEDAVLFFDEADSFLGKRLTTVTSSSDQAVNSLRSKLLQLLEDHRGVVIFCTNLLKNYDRAFQSRILRSLKFTLPDDTCRRKMIRRMIPQKVPFLKDEFLDEEAIGELSMIVDRFSGREIKNAILHVLCQAALDERTEFRVKDFKEGFCRSVEERKKVAEESGELTQARKDALSNTIKEKLATGDFAKCPES